MPLTFLLATLGTLLHRRLSLVAAHKTFWWHGQSISALPASEENVALHPCPLQDTCLAGRYFRGFVSLVCVEVVTSFGMVLVHWCTPRGLVEQGTRAIFSGEQGNKGLIMKETGEQRQFCGTGNVGNRDFYFREQGKMAIYFRGTRPWTCTPSPGRPLHCPGPKITLRKYLTIETSIIIITIVSMVKHSLS